MSTDRASGPGLEKAPMNSAVPMHTSYALMLPLKYQPEEQQGFSGRGQTLTVSSKSIRFRCDRELRVGLKIRLELEWPAGLPDGTRLNLWVYGVVTRSAKSESDVRINRYEFRTRRSPQAAAAVAALPRLIISGT